MPAVITHILASDDADGNRPPVWDLFPSWGLRHFFLQDYVVLLIGWAECHNSSDRFLRWRSIHKSKPISISILTFAIFILYSHWLFTECRDRIRVFYIWTIPQWHWSGSPLLDQSIYPLFFHAVPFHPLSLGQWSSMSLFIHRRTVVNFRKEEISKVLLWIYFCVILSKKQATVSPITRS